jgi:hypothetical protein
MAIHRTGPVEPITVAVALTGQVPTNTIRAGDLLALQSNAAVPASVFTWTTDLATTQTNFAAAFLGISAGDSFAASTDPRQTEMLITQDGDVEFDLTVAAAAAFNVGSFVGPSKAAGNNLLHTVESVATKARAVAVVVKLAPIGSTKVVARLLNTTIKR